MPRITARNRSSIFARRGFTLIETIATIVVLAIIGTVTSSIILNSVDIYNRWSTRADMQSQLSGAMDRIVTEIGTIGPAPSVTPVQPDISSITATSMTYNPGTSSRTLTLTGTNLTLLGAAGVTANLAQNVSAFNIQAQDKDGTNLAATLGSLAACASVRRLQITITATANGLSQSLRTRVYITSMSYGSNSP